VLGDWLQRLFTVPAVRALDTKTQRKQFSDEDHESVHVIGYLDQGTTNKETFDTFSRVARHFQNDIDFLLVTRADAAKSLKIKRDNSLVIYRPSEKPHVIEEVSQYDFAALVKQINELNTPLYQDFSFFNVFRVFAGSKPKVIAAVSESKEQSQDVLNAFKSAAKNLQDEFDFVLFNGGIFGAFLPLVGLDVSQLPTLAIVGIKGLETVWDPEQQVTNKAVLNWLREWHAAQPREVEIPVFSAESAVTHLDLAALNACCRALSRDTCSSSSTRSGASTVVPPHLSGSNSQHSSAHRSRATNSWWVHLTSIRRHCPSKRSSMSQCCRASCSGAHTTARQPTTTGQSHSQTSHNSSLTSSV
jgi:hypothetical protein